MQNVSAWLLPLSGLALGAGAGYAMRRARMCTFGAIEDALIGGDSRRLRVLALALGIAVLGTQALVIGGWLDPNFTTYVPPALPVLSIAMGSILFGLGMALVGTCGFGSLVRLGGGDLRSLVVVLVLSATAYMTLRGVLADVRVNVLESFSLQMPDAAPADLATLISRGLGIDARPPLALLLGAGLCWLAIGDARLRRAPRLITSGAVLGLMVVAGWIVTRWLADEFSGPLRVQSLTFVSPMAKAFYAAVLNIASLADFGVGSVFGVIFGSTLASWRAGDLRWEAFDDDREMRRHLGGAVLMGVGGILAGGCTIGQGITAGSIFALSAPIAIIGMIIGARFGIALLVDGATREAMQRSVDGLLGRSRLPK